MRKNENQVEANIQTVEKFIPGGLLSYRLDLLVDEYFKDEFLEPREQLASDVIDLLKDIIDENDNQLDKDKYQLNEETIEIRRSLEVLHKALSWSRYMKADELYDIDLYDFTSSETVSGIPRFKTEDPRFHYSFYGYLNDLESVEYEFSPNDYLEFIIKLLKTANWLTLIFLSDPNLVSNMQDDYVLYLAQVIDGILKRNKSISPTMVDHEILDYINTHRIKTPVLRSTKVKEICQKMDNESAGYNKWCIDENTKKTIYCATYFLPNKVRQDLTDQDIIEVLEWSIEGESYIKTFPNIRRIIEWLEMQRENSETDEATSSLLNGLIASLYIAANKDEEAKKVYQEMQNTGQINSSDYYNLGTIYLSNYLHDKRKNTDDNLSLAEERFKKALEIEPQLIEAIYSLGLLYLYRGEWKKAIDQFSQIAKPCNLSAKEIKQTDGIPLDYLAKQYSCNNLGICYYREESIKEAYKWFEAASSWGWATKSAIGKDNQYKLFELVSGSTPPEEADRGMRSEFVFGDKKIIGKSRAMNEVYKLIDLFADSSENILITGRTGTGKELVAGAIHKTGPRKDSPFITVNCAAIASELIESELFGHERGAFSGAHKQHKGYFEQANGGVIFLDEINSMGLNLQSRLLRVVEDKVITRVGGTEEIPTDVSIISGTNKDLELLVKAGTFREDLYYRLNVLAIETPPLRERKEDIPLLIDHIKKVAANEAKKSEITFSGSAINLLSEHNWDGNVRQLKNLIIRLTTIYAGKHIFPSDIQKELRETIVVDENTEKSMIIEAIESSKTITEAINKLLFGRTKFYELIKKYGINTKAIKNKKSK